MELYPALGPGLDQGKRGSQGAKCKEALTSGPDSVPTALGGSSSLWFVPWAPFSCLTLVSALVVSRERWIWKIEHSILGSRLEPWVHMTVFPPLSECIIGMNSCGTWHALPLGSWPVG